MCGSMVDITLRIGDEKKKKERKTTAAKYNGLLYWAAIIQADIHHSD